MRWRDIVSRYLPPRSAVFIDDCHVISWQQTSGTFIVIFLLIFSGIHQINLLNLSYTNMKDESAKALFQCLCRGGRIEVLTLRGNKITDEAAQSVFDFLNSNKTLKGLDLSLNKITDEGVRVISKALMNNNTLACLSLSNNSGITDEGVTSLCRSLKNNYSLKSLELEKVNVTSVSCDTFKTAFRTNHALQKLVFRSSNKTDSSNSVLELQFGFMDRSITCYR